MCVADLVAEVALLLGVVVWCGDNGGDDNGGACMYDVLLLAV